MRCLSFLVLAVAVTIPSVPLRAESFAPQVQEAIATLAAATTIEAPAVGIVGGPSEQTAAYRILRRDENGLEAFRLVLAKADSTTGKIYALLGIYQQDPASYARLSRSIKRSEVLMTMNGCIFSERPAWQLLQGIVDGSLQKFVAPPLPPPAPRASLNSKRYVAR